MAEGRATASALTLSIESDAAALDRAAVERGLVEHAEARVEPRKHRSLAVFARDAAGAVAGGLLGKTVWGWLHVDSVWVAPEHRGRGTGTWLMRAAEEEAARRGCRHAYLDTFDFQALPFYEKLGFEVFGRLEDFPSGHVRYFLRKRGLGSSG